MRRREGTLIPLEISILSAGLGLRNAGEPDFHGFQLAKELRDQDRGSTTHRPRDPLQGARSHGAGGPVAEPLGEPGRSPQNTVGPGVVFTGSLGTGSRRSIAPSWTVWWACRSRTAGWHEVVRRARGRGRQGLDLRTRHGYRRPSRRRGGPRSIPIFGSTRTPPGRRRWTRGRLPGRSSRGACLGIAADLTCAHPAGSRRRPDREGGDPDERTGQAELVDPRLRSC